MITEKDLLTLLKREIEFSGNQKNLAKKIGVSETYLSDILKRTRTPGNKILKYLKLKKVIYYSSI